MSQLPMKVSEAVELLNEVSENGLSRTSDAIRAILKSHEALRLAGVKMVAANHPEGSVQDFAEAHEALSLAVEDASK